MQHLTYISFAFILIIFACRAKVIQLYVSETSRGHILSIKRQTHFVRAICYNANEREADPFYVSSHTCQLRIKDGEKLDFEKKKRYEVNVGIHGQLKRERMYKSSYSFFYCCLTYILHNSSSILSFVLKILLLFQARLALTKLSFTFMLLM